VSELQLLFGHLQNSGKVAFSPNKFVEFINIDTDVQQDAQE